NPGSDGRMRPPRCFRCRSALSLLLGAALLYVIAETTPHLVHHLFETEQEPECEFLAVADHATAATAPLLIFVLTLAACGRTEPVPAPRFRLTPVRAPASRGPPSPSLA